MIRIDVAGGRPNFRPGGQVTANVEWSFSGSPGPLAVRLIWFTRGKGIDDTTVIEQQDVPDPRESGRRQFTFALPETPYSFKGKLIHLFWAVAAEAEGADERERAEFIMSPSGQEVWIGEPDAE